MTRWNWDAREKFGKLSMHDLDLMKLITGFVPCCTDIVALYPDGADEGAGLHVESRSECGGPRFVGSAALAFLATSSNLNTKQRGVYASSPLPTTHLGSTAVFALQRTDVGLPLHRCSGHLIACFAE